MSIAFAQLDWGSAKSVVLNPSRVVDIEEQPIPGFYAPGEMVGGLFYFNYPGGSGLTSGAVFGRIVGESAAQYSVRR